MGIQVLSIGHHQIEIGHCLERGLGYMPSTQEFGLGFIQALWNPNAITLHDKISETIVIQGSKFPIRDGFIFLFRFCRKK